MKNFFSPIKTELDAVEQQLVKNIKTDLILLDEASAHLIKAGGKRIRPGFALLAARMYMKSLDQAIPLAVSLELIHMASLVHDDVIDDSETRRGTETVKKRWGNRMSIYAGDYILARALAVVNEYNRSDVVDVLADASMRICEGEIKQMLSCYDVKQGLKDYLRRIQCKTALLISVSCQLGAMISDAPPEEIEAMKNFGYYVGMAFQITDDILDFIADEKTLGKPTGNDVRQGIITLPAIYALKFLPERRELAKILSSPESCHSNTLRIIDMVVQSGGIEYAHRASRKYASIAQQQLRFIPDRPEKQILLDVADSILERQF
ncbi:MAG TPA: polyprenyl synthetase family protein [Syntrophomonadaceae bacterium]|nr:polyprenyl synthetase family protein [Syntrophomonadaceae bacterium]